MSLRKIAVLLAAGGLAVGLIGGGVGAQFTDQVKAIQNITVGTFGCSIASTQGTVVGKTVTYNGTLTSSAAGSAPFDFTVAPTGSIGVHAVVSVTTAPLSPFTALMPSYTVADIAVGNSFTFTGAGLSWPTLDNNQLGKTYSVTYTVDCTDQGGGFSSVIFDNTPATVTSALASYGAQAYSFNEWGGGVTFAPGGRKLATATVILKSYTCQLGAWNGNPTLCSTPTPGSTYNTNVTFNVYDVNLDGTVGGVIATKTQSVAVPFRPSADPIACPSNTSAFWDGTGCRSGLSFPVTFVFTGQTLPDTAAFGITYNTDQSGYSPIGGSTAPTDSLNIATYPGTIPAAPATQASVGTWLPNDTSTYVNPRAGGHAVNMTTLAPVTQMPTGPSDNFVGYMPAVQITATN